MVDARIVAVVRDEMAVMMDIHGASNGNFPLVLPLQMRRWIEALSRALALAEREEGEADGG